MRNRKNEILGVLLGGGGGYFLATYLNFKFVYLTAIVIGCLILFCFYKNIKRAYTPRKEIFLIGLFSVLLSICIILGFHIQVANIYRGTIEENYIVPYCFEDLIAFVFISVGIFEIVQCIFRMQREQKIGRIVYCDNKIEVYSIIIVALVLFVAWLPYLFVYSPGFVFNDTIASIEQALGWEALNNHHPIVYTLFIKFCFKIGNFLGDNTIGCIIYCLIQMLYMSIALSYLINWLHKRFDINKNWLIVLIAFYGVTPYFAQMSIAMWKDPIFSVTLVLLTLIIMDIILGKDNRKKMIYFLKYIVFLFIMIFSRNNGIYIAFFISISCILLSFLKARKIIHKVLRRIAISTLFVVIISQVIMGPIYNSLGIRKEKVESYGIFLNQMARVVAYEGEMTEEDRDYMNRLLPLELYKNKYFPCCVDLLKWDKDFNSDVLEEDFFKHYFSMFVSNPRIYFEAWELQTYGFWTINCEEINYYPGNITGGVPINCDPKNKGEFLERYGIKAGKYVEHEVLTKIFPKDDMALPIGLINWGVILLILFILLQKKEILLGALMPTVGLMITLIIASPIAYWPRYGAAMQYLLPFYITLFLVDRLKKQNITQEGKSNG